MPKKEFLVPEERYDVSRPIAGVDEIRRYIPQRYEMEQLQGILYESIEEYSCVGFKQVRPDEFWVRGHMPGAPLLPGVLFCEGAAQLASYFIGRFDMMDGEMMGFAGLEDVKFRGIVRPGDTVIFQTKMLKCRKILITAQFMAIVGSDIVSEGVIKGFPLKREYLQ